MTPSRHPAAPHHLPMFIAGPDGSDVFMTVMAVVLVDAVLGIGLFLLRIHTLPERIAHTPAGRMNGLTMSPTRRVNCSTRPSTPARATVSRS